MTPRWFETGSARYFPAPSATSSVSSRRYGYWRMLPTWIFSRAANSPRLFPAELRRARWSGPKSATSSLKMKSALESLQGFFGAYSAVYSWLGSQQKEFVRRLQRVAPGKARIFPFAPTHARLHQTDYYLGCLNLSSLAGAQPVIELNRHEAAWCDEFFSLHDLHRRPILAMAAGSGAREKNWPEEFFLAVAEWWRDRIGGAVVLLVGPVEEERGGIERLDRQCVVARGLNLSQIAALIARSHVYLGNDSGISHIAAATGVRSVVLFGPSAAEQWAPRGRKVEILSRNIECSPCSERLMKNCWHRSCLTAFESKEVISFLAHLPEVLTLTRARPGITV